MGDANTPVSTGRLGGHLILYALIAWAGLSLPAVLALNLVAAPWPVLTQAVLASGGLLLLAIGLFGLVGRRHALWGLWLLLGLLMAVRLTHYGVVDFSGFGFTDEFFLHWGMASARVAIMEYDRELIIAGLLLGVIGAALRPIARLGLKQPPRALAGLCVLGLALAGMGRDALPEWRLWQAYSDWRNPLAVLEGTDRVTRNQLIELGLLEVELPYKHQVTATPPSQPKNLIVLYLESVGVNLADHPRWPDLMPNLQQLLEEHAWVDHLWASGYITIEGLTNTQCGTLVPFNRGSESIADGEGLVDSLPCLGDVLHKAGYRQTFLGGAETTFAGKGEFLSRHGFDDVVGLEHWRERGLNSRPNTWGLSDPDLFNESLSVIEQLSDQDAPWHLAMLTIGTHLPGYLYEECQPYSGGDERFLDALHCTDQLMGQWIQTLEDNGTLDDTVLVITSDHQVFPNAEMRGLFGDGVSDRRLPMIVLGPADAEASLDEGAGYDFAPSVLDILGIDHNARFVLGRSLSRPITRPDYFLTRYGDVFQGARVTNASECDDQKASSLPLNACQKGEFLSILGLISERFSNPISRLACGLDHIRIQPTDITALEIIVGGEDQTDRFIRSGRPIDIAQGGWAMLFLDQRGEVINRAFIAHDEVAMESSAILDEHFNQSHSQVLIWTGEDQAPSLPGLSMLATKGPHAWWLAGKQRVLAESRASSPTQSAHKTLAFDQSACRRAIEVSALQGNLL